MAVVATTLLALMNQHCDSDAILVLFVLFSVVVLALVIGGCIALTIDIPLQKWMYDSSEGCVVLPDPDCQLIFYALNSGTTEKIELSGGRTVHVSNGHATSAKEITLSSSSLTTTPLVPVRDPSQKEVTPLLAWCSTIAVLLMPITLFALTARFTTCTSVPTGDLCVSSINATCCCCCCCC